jgi:hypothetical protein
MVPLASESQSLTVTTDVVAGIVTVIGSRFVTVYG